MPLIGYGSTTFRREAKERGEPDGRSTFIPTLDFAVLAEFVRRPDQYRAALAFRDHLTSHPRS